MTFDKRAIQDAFNHQNGQLESFKESKTDLKLVQFIKPPKKTDPDESSLYKGSHLTIKGYILIISLAGTIFAGCASYSLIAPFFPRIAEQKGLTISQYSIIFAVYEMGRFIMPPFCSRLAIRMTPKVFLMTGLLIIAWSCTIFGFLIYSRGGRPFLIICIVVRCFWSAGGSSVTTTANLLGTILFPQHVPLMFSCMEIAAGLGVVAGPFFGGYLYELGGFPVPFIFTSLFCLLSMIPIGLLVQKELKPKTEKEKVKPTTFSQTMSVPGVSINLFISSVTSFAIGFNEATLEYHLREIGNYSPSQVGYVFLISGLIYSFWAYGIGLLANKWQKSYYLLFIGLILLTGSFVVVGPLPFIPVKPNLFFVLCSQTFFGIGTAFLFVLSFDDMIKEGKKYLPDNETTMAAISGLYTSSYALGTAIGPFVGGQLVERYGYRNATTPIALSMVFLTLLAFIYVIKFKKNVKGVQ